VHAPSRLALALAALLPLAAPGCRRLPLSLRTATAADTAWVGVAVGLQSPERYVNVFKGVQLALDELNERPPEGAPVLAMRRPPSGVRSHVDVAIAFRDDPGVVAVVGHTESDPTIDAAVVYDDREHDGVHALAAVTPSASGTMVTRVSDWVFRVAPPVTQQAEAIARHADSLGLRRVVLVYRNDIGYKDFQRAFTAEFSRLGGTVVERLPFVEEIDDFGAYGRHIAALRADGLILGGNGSDALRALRALKAAGATPLMISVNPPGSSESDPERLFAGAHYLATFAPGHRITATSPAFERSFAARFGRAPDHWAALGYDAARLIGEAVQLAGADRRGVRDAIAAVGRTRPPYVGAAGEIRFDAEGDPVQKQMLVLEAR
jgi:branched-chain amino acid transport system substrate-binding protein